MEERGHYGDTEDEDGSSDEDCSMSRRLAAERPPINFNR